MTDMTVALSASAEQQGTSTADVGDLYQRHQPWLVNWLRGKLGSSQDAGDICQDTFVKVMSGDAIILREPRAYLLVVANRLLINRYRRAKVETDVLQQVAGLIDILNSGADHKGPAEIVVARDLLRRVLLMLTEELPEKPRKAYLMARVDGLSYDKIAIRLGVSVSSVKQYLARVLVHCHTRFYDEFID